MYLECDPCNIKYDAITHTETLTSDVQIVAKQLKYSHTVEFPNANNSTGRKSTMMTQVEKIAKNYADWKISNAQIFALRDKYSRDLTQRTNIISIILTENVWI